MKYTVLILLCTLFMCSCGEQKSNEKGVDSTVVEKVDPKGVSTMAEVMTADLQRFIKDNDVQSAASLCQEAIDNIDYFKEIGETEAAQMYASALAKFIKKNRESLGDMSTQNYVVKQFVTSVYAMAGGVQNDDSETTPSNGYTVSSASAGDAGF